MFRKNFRQRERPSFQNRGGGRRFGKNGSGARRFGLNLTKIHHSRFIKKTFVNDEKIEEFMPQNDFQDFSFEVRLKDNIQKKGYLKPTPIQDKAIPFIIENKDVVGIANTGTGKTAAFLLPLLQKVLLDKTQRVLILVPTRELAMQIDEEFKSFSVRMGVFSVLCIGGANINRQRMELRKKRPHFVIGTPGRIKDLHNRKCLPLQLFNNVVLDEADRMLDMGFVREIKYLLGFLPKERQSLFFSATISREIRELIESFLKDPITVSVKIQETSDNIEQDIVKVPTNKNKLEVLHDLLNREEFEKVLIFGRTKRGVERLSIALGERGFIVASVHGNKPQSKRQLALNLFRTDKVRVLIATDVMARGMDIPNVSHVINFDPPATYDDYVHRIGRTGRAGQRGMALTFVD